MPSPSNKPGQEGRFVSSWQFRDDILGAAIPSMVLQPLVEK
jgi:hypothetical protein